MQNPVEPESTANGTRAAIEQSAVVLSGAATLTCGGAGGSINEARKRRPRDLPGQTITAGSVREVLAANVLSRRHNMPGDAELEQLACDLDVLRRVILDESKLADLRKLQRETLTAAKRLADVLYKLRQLTESHAVAAVAAPAGVQFILNPRATAAKNACAEVERIIAWCSTGLRTRGWKWLADHLSAALVNAMKPANPIFAPGLSPEGPLVRFIAAVAPLITGEHPTSASVATQLKLRRRVGRRAASASQAGDPSKPATTESNNNYR